MSAPLSSPTSCVPVPQCCLALLLQVLRGHELLARSSATDHGNSCPTKALEESIPRRLGIPFLDPNELQCSEEAEEPHGHGVAMRSLAGNTARPSLLCSRSDVDRQLQEDCQCSEEPEQSTNDARLDSTDEHVCQANETEPSVCYEQSSQRQAVLGAPRGVHAERHDGPAKTDGVQRVGDHFANSAAAENQEVADHGNAEADHQFVAVDGCEHRKREKKEAGHGWQDSGGGDAVGRKANHLVTGQPQALALISDRGTGKSPLHQSGTNAISYAERVALLKYEHNEA